MKLSAWPSLMLSLCALSCSDVSPVPTDTTSTQGIADGELCYAPESQNIRLNVQPNHIVLAPGASRTVRVIVEPDFCEPITLRAESLDETVVASADDIELSYGTATGTIVTAAKQEGSTTIELSLDYDGETVRSSVTVDVIAPGPITCDGSNELESTTLTAGSTLRGSGALTAASIHLPTGADAPNSGSFLWSVSPFDASIACAEDMTPAGHIALGPAVKFGPGNTRWLRDMPLTVPAHPARMPDQAKLRHIKIMYRGPQAKRPRPVPVSDLRFEQHEEHWAVHMMVPRLGEYQAVVASDAGASSRSRRLTHRAIIGVSMGGSGTALMGLRQHQLFDVIAPLGGPVDWTWLIDHLANNHLGGFPSIPPGTELKDIAVEKTTCQKSADCPGGQTCLGVIADPPAAGRCTLLPEADEPYEHPSTFNNWWYEYPREGHGGSFPRDNYIQIFRDIALTFGNPNSYNPLALHLPAGADPTHKSVVGEQAGDACAIWLDSIDGHPNEAQQKEFEKKCPKERCANTLVLKNYYDDEYNPDGTFDVITVCDGGPRDEKLTPYANTWNASGNNYPLEVGLAVDYNQNGVRDEMEPIIRAGHEPWSDFGSDGVASKDEPGYGPDNLDPSGDDYDPQYNPGGTEGDHRYQLGEPFEDVGLDSVPNTKSSPYDHGENDGVFTVAEGLRNLWSYDSRSRLRDFSDDTTTSLTDAQLSRLDMWVDGGTRDLFNCAVAAQHLAGGFAARERPVGYYSNFVTVPGLDPTNPQSYNPAYFAYDDLPGVVMQRYGANEPTANEIENGSGQHVGTANEVAKRLQSALYFIGSRWKNASRSLVQSSKDAPAPNEPECAVYGTCVFDFTSSFGRTGPVAISFPPGYANEGQQHVRYPVIYMLHGYGQTPEDLSATIVLLSNWMNSPLSSQATRLPKAILVYVDGRCREGADGKPECIRGSFFTDSAREQGPQMEKWWLELIDHVDQNYRTMSEQVVSWPN